MPVSISCTNCAAPLHATGRNRRVRCAFCETDNLLDAGLCAQLMKQAPVAPPPVAKRLEGLEALARKDAKDFLEALARKLEAALPGRVEVDRAGLFSSHVEEVTADLDEFRYSVHLGHHHALEGKRAHVVRGIVLRSDPLDAGQIVSALGAELYERGIEEPGEHALDRFCAA